MQKMMKSHYSPYVIVLAILTYIVFLPGCAPKPTIIHLARPLDPAYQLSQGALVPTVGQFTAPYPDYIQYAQYVQQYLKQRLAEVQPLSTVSAEDSQPFQIHGMVKLHRLTDSKNPKNITVHTEVTFNLYDPKSKTDRQSIVSRGQTQENTQSAIQALLRQTVDFYVSQMFPQEITIACAMARGKSKFDLRGRQAAADADFDRAFEFFRKAIDEFPDDHAALYNAGLVSEALKIYPRALKYYQRALKLADLPEYNISLHRVQDIIDASL
jgi:tetratricopeptide (TPR) repeat protein